jgi:uncharacterized protein YbjT (DUF2867 family)
MKVLVLAATGGTGRLIVSDALAFASEHHLRSKKGSFYVKLPHAA